MTDDGSKRAEAWTDVPGHGDTQYLVGAATPAPSAETEAAWEDLRRAEDGDSFNAGWNAALDASQGLANTTGRMETSIGPLTVEGTADEVSRVLNSVRVPCQCGRSVFAANWENHMRRQSGGPHGSAIRTEPAGGLDALVIARTAHINHMSGEADDCDGDDQTLWCSACWADAVRWLDPKESFGIDSDLAARLADTVP